MEVDEMRAVQIQDYGGPEVLNLVKTAIPMPGRGQVLVRLQAAGVNPADWKSRAGYMRANRPLAMPWTPGLEGAGVVEAVGPGVTRFQPGQAVYGTIAGSYAEYALAQENDLQPKPASLSFEEAAAVPVGALTAWGAVINTAEVQPGQRVLVQGAAGGVGLFMVQLACWKGTQVYGTASTANQDFVRSLGAEPIDYSAGPVEQHVHDLDAVFDTVGGDIPQRSLPLLRRGGIFVTVAAMPPEDYGEAEGIRWSRGGRAPGEQLAEISRLIEAGQVKPVIYRVFPLSEARQAQELSQTGHARGRIVLKIAP